MSAELVKVDRDSLRQMYETLCAAHDLNAALTVAMNGVKDPEGLVRGPQSVYEQCATLFFLFNPIARMFEDDKEES